MNHKKRSQIKRQTLEGKVLRYMRTSKGISMRAAGALVNLSDSAISHYEHGRMDLSPDRILTLVKAYGFEEADLVQFQSGKPIPLDARDECYQIMGQLPESKLTLVHQLLLNLKGTP